MRRGRVFRERKRRKSRTVSINQQFKCDLNPCASYSDLLKWMKKQGFKQNKRLMPYIFTDTGRGLSAKETIYAGDVIISVPKKLLITPTLVLGSYLGPHINRCCPDAKGEEILAVFIMCEKIKNEESFWHPFIATLPKFYTIPAYFKNNLLSMLPISVKHSVLEQKQLVKKSFQKLENVFASLEDQFPEFIGMFHYEIYLWAWSTVNTRCVYIECEDRQCKGKSCTYHLALAPFLDLLNHHVDAQVKAGFNKEKQSYEIRSLKCYRKHSQVFINYGNHSNRKLFAEYGFVLPNNFNDIIPVSLGDILSACRNINIPNAFLQREMFLQQQSSLLSSNLGLCKDGLTWGLDNLLKVICSEIVIKSFASIFHDIKLNDVERIKYDRLARAVIFIKLKDYVILDKEQEMTSHMPKDPQTQSVLNIVRQHCILEQKMLKMILNLL